MQQTIYKNCKNRCAVHVGFCDNLRLLKFTMSIKIATYKLIQIAMYNKDKHKKDKHKEIKP
ncbi:hypothetical protein MOMA_06236 [Moraxella macacae 0408225]|uniref:Uncharacterized protein n=1 Tax=Moraxella macacae 0408225 TaxID=1230338 RepID=L2F548_9GAMM|nr:hypothetical protein MOMA_06236 [Moraxella macacae 0408225]